MGHTLIFPNTLNTLYLSHSLCLLFLPLHTWSGHTHMRTHTLLILTRLPLICVIRWFFSSFSPWEFPTRPLRNERKWRMGLWASKATTLVVPQQGSLGYVGASGLRDTRGVSLIGKDGMWVWKEKSKNWQEKLGVREEEEGTERRVKECVSVCVCERMTKRESGRREIVC